MENRVSSDDPKRPLISPDAPTRPSLSAEAPTIRSQVSETAVPAGASRSLGLGNPTAQRMPPSVQLPTGTLVADRYRIQKVIGVGGMGMVYKVHDEVLGVDLALKLLLPEIAHEADFLQRFRNELVVARQVTHRNAVRIHDIGEHDGTYFMSMDLVEGRSLQDVLKEEGKLELSRAVGIVRQVAEALAEAHRKGVVHRDLKPANILLDHEGNAYITDFGIARSRSVPGLTRTGEVLGTPDYLSPEQARGEQVDGRSDLYSLGLMFLEMLSGKRPFPGGTIFEVLARRMTAKIASLEELGIKVPPTWSAILQRLVALDKEERYQSAEEFLADLDDLRRPGLRRRKEQAKKAALAIGAFVLAMLFGLGLKSLWDARVTTSPSTESATPGVVEAVDGHHSVAVLPFAAESDLGDLSWAPRALAELLTVGLAESGDLRVVDHLRILHRLEDLGADPNALRPGQLEQLGQTFQVDRLVVGRLQRTDGLVVLEGELVLLDGGEPASRPLAPQQGDTDSLFSLLAGFREDLWGALDAAPEETPISASDSEEPSRPQHPSVPAMEELSEGLRLLARGETVSAGTALTRAVAQDPTLAVAWMHLAHTRLELGKQTEALEATQQAVLVTVEGERLGMEARAQEALLRGDPETAQAFLETLVGRYPFDAEARLSLSEAFGQQGRFKEAISQLERAVELDAGNPHSWYLLGRYSIGVGELRRAVDEYLVRALVLENTLRNEMGQALVLNALGVGYQRLGLLDQAQENYEKAATIRRRIGDAPGLASTLRNLVWVNLARGTFENAEETIQSALEIHSDMDDPGGLAELYNAYGTLEEERGNYPEALEHYRRSLQLGRDLGNEDALAETHNNVGFIYFLLAEYDNALLHLEKALDLHRRNEQRIGVVRALQSIGFCRQAQGAWTEAQASFEEALGLARELEERAAVAVSLGNLGRVAQFEGRYEAAFRHYREALDLMAELEDQRGLVEFSLFAAEAALELGDLASADADLEQVVDWLQEGGNREQQARLELFQSLISLRRGDLEAARENSSSALAAANASQSVVTILEARLAAGRIELAESNYEAAREAFGSVFTEADRLDHTRLLLQSAEALATAQLKTGQPAAAAETLRSALRIVTAGDSYARSFQLHALQAAALEASGNPAGAARAQQEAEESLESLRGKIDLERLTTFDDLPEVRALRNPSG